MHVSVFASQYAVVETLCQTNNGRNGATLSNWSIVVCALLSSLLYYFVYSMNVERATINILHNAMDRRLRWNINVHYFIYFIFLHSFSTYDSFYGCVVDGWIICNDLSIWNQNGKMFCCSFYLRDRVVLDEYSATVCCWQIILVIGTNSVWLFYLLNRNCRNWLNQNHASNTPHSIGSVKKTIDLLFVSKIRLCRIFNTLLCSVSL